MDSDSEGSSDTDNNEKHKNGFIFSLIIKSKGGKLLTKRTRETKNNAESYADKHRKIFDSFVPNSDELYLKHSLQQLSEILASYR